MGCSLRSAAALLKMYVEIKSSDYHLPAEYGMRRTGRSSFSMTAADCL